MNLTPKVRQKMSGRWYIIWTDQVIYHSDESLCINPVNKILLFSIDSFIGWNVESQIYSLPKFLYYAAKSHSLT